MALIVQKFGGTSVGSPERIQRVADIILKTRAAGHDVVAVVSAMSGETDRLVQLAKAMQPVPSPREYSVLVSTGEQVSMALLCMALMTKGCPAKSYTGMQAGIKTDHHYHKAKVEDVDCAHIHDDLAQGKVVVVAGFQGGDEEGNITTLGRGGSDTTGVILAVGLQADECQIYTDVEGVYTADPRIVPQARCLEQLTFEEMLELSSLGAKVLQIRSVEFASKYNVALRVLSSFAEGQGTLITQEDFSVENPVVSGLAYNKNEALITVLNIPDKPGIASFIVQAVSDAGIDIDMIVQNHNNRDVIDFTFTMHKEDHPRALELVEQVMLPYEGVQILGDKKIAKLSLVGVGMRHHAGIATIMFKALAEEAINIMLVATSEIKISVVVDEKYLELGLRALHSAFQLDKKSIEESNPKQS